MIRVSNINVSVLSDENALLKKISRIINCNKNDIKNYKIIKKSIDARDKNNIIYNYTIDINVENEDEVLNKKIKNVSKTPNEEYTYKPSGTLKMKNRPIVVGAGPAGLFLSYMLSYYGYNPIIIERGEKMEDRIKSVDIFFSTNKLNINSNVQFGEGGAGTFSDGKLNTLVKDKRFMQKKVFEIFIECGAPEEILYVNKPHIGTDLLRKVIINMRNKIIKNGGTFLYNTMLTNIVINNNKVEEIIVNNKETIPCDNLFLCIGHSSRETYNMLKNKNILMKNKPFAIGVRIEHLKKDINECLYGNKYKDILKDASYNLTYHTNNRAVYTFCMCPGGYVINASSEKNKLVINGMSNHLRESNNSNSAIVVTIDENDYGKNLLDGVKFQRELEEKAYNSLNGLIPVQRYIDYKNNVVTNRLGKITPNTKGNYGFYDINKILPNYINSSIKESIEYFSKRINCFNDDDSILLGIETRTSSPVTIIRDEKGMSNIKGIYPVGEGAGYAGGITTSAVDGIRTFEKFTSIYKK